MNHSFKEEYCFCLSSWGRWCFKVGLQEDKACHFKSLLILIILQCSQPSLMGEKADKNRHIEFSYNYYYENEQS